MTLKTEQWDWDELEQSEMQGDAFRFTEKADSSYVLISWK